MCREVGFVATYRYSDNWGGDELRYQSTYQFNGVKANFYQASLGTGCGPLSTLAEWVGLGGDSGVWKLAQAGTIAHGPGFEGYPPYQGFYEYLTPTNPTNPPVVFPDTVSAGNAMFAEVTYDSGFLSFWVENVTRGWAHLVNVYAPDAYDGTSAEWIDEREYNLYLGLTNLTNYGWTYWYNMQVHRSTASWSTWSGAYYEPTEWWIQMYTGGHYLSKTTGTYSDSHMRDHWYACS
jgi:hypothetical protein